MAYDRKGICLKCDSFTNISRRGLCEDCGKQILQNTYAELRSGKGNIHDKWKQNKEIGYEKYKQSIVTEKRYKNDLVNNDES